MVPLRPLTKTSPQRALSTVRHLQSGYEHDDEARSVTSSEKNAKTNRINSCAICFLWAPPVFHTNTPKGRPSYTHFKLKQGVFVAERRTHLRIVCALAGYMPPCRIAPEPKPMIAQIEQQQGHESRHMQTTAKRTRGAASQQHMLTKNMCANQNERYTLSVVAPRGEHKRGTTLHRCQPSADLVIVDFDVPCDNNRGPAPHCCRPPTDHVTTRDVRPRVFCGFLAVYSNWSPRVTHKNSVTRSMLHAAAFLGGGEKAQCIKDACGVLARMRNNS